jgi:hypothetical protein
MTNTDRLAQALRKCLIEMNACNHQAMGRNGTEGESVTLARAAAVEALAEHDALASLAPAAVEGDAPKCLSLPLELDSLDNEGNYGDGGPDCRSGFKSSCIRDANGKVILDTLNADIACVHEDHDGDEYGSWSTAWDEDGRQRLAHIVRAVNERAALTAQVAALTAQCEGLRKDAEDAKRWRWIMAQEGSEYKSPPINELWKKVFAENRRGPTVQEWNEAVDSAIAAGNGDGV